MNKIEQAIKEIEDRITYCPLQKCRWCNQDNNILFGIHIGVQHAQEEFLDIIQQIFSKLEKIQKFIEEIDSKDSHGRPINDFDKLCFVQEDLTKLKELKQNIKELCSLNSLKTKGLLRLGDKK